MRSIGRRRRKSAAVECSSPPLPDGCCWTSSSTAPPLLALCCANAAAPVSVPASTLRSQSISSSSSRRRPIGFASSCTPSCSCSCSRSSLSSPALFISCSFVLCLLLCSMPELAEARGGRRTGQGKGKSGLQFAQVAEFSLIQQALTDNRSAHIVTGSYFSQVFRLGFKLRLICKARGDPRPKIKWFKEGMEMQPKRNAHYYEKPLGKEEIWSKLEIDPATMGDQGIYACVANNQYGVMAKNFKAERERLSTAFLFYPQLFLLLSPFFLFLPAPPRVQSYK